MDAEDVDQRNHDHTSSQPSAEVVPSWDTLGTPSPETSKRPVRRRVRRRPTVEDQAAADAGPTAATMLADWAWQHGMTQTPTGSLLEGLAALLDGDDAFTALGEPDARRVVSMVALDLVMYAQMGLVGVAVMNRAVAA